MAQKVNPIAVRLGLNRHCDSNWFSDYYYSTLLSQDYQIRHYLSRIKQPIGTKIGFRPARSIIHHYPKKSSIYVFCLAMPAIGFADKTKADMVRRLRASVGASGRREDHPHLPSLADTRLAHSVSTLLSHRTKGDKREPSLGAVREKERKPERGPVSIERLGPLKHYSTDKRALKGPLSPDLRRLFYLSDLTSAACKTLVSEGGVGPKGAPSSSHNNLQIVKSRHYNLSNLQHVLSKQNGSFTSIIPVQVNSMYQSACLVAQDICYQLEQAKSFRQISKGILHKIEQVSYIKGIRIACSGRLNGAEIAKTECKKYGESSLHVFSDRIDYASMKASTPYGILGVKVWISYL